MPTPGPGQLGQWKRGVKRVIRRQWLSKQHQPPALQLMSLATQQLWAGCRLSWS